MQTVVYKVQEAGKVDSQSAAVKFKNISCVVIIIITITRPIACIIQL